MYCFAQGRENLPLNRNPGTIATLHFSVRVCQEARSVGTLAPDDPGETGKADKCSTDYQEVV